MTNGRWATRWAAIGVGACLAAASLTTVVGAQSPPGGSDKPKSKDADVPPAFRPPPGMCRVWLNGVPPGQQPAPTDCASAVRNRPSNGRVLFGDDYVSRKTGRIAVPVTTFASHGPSAEDVVVPAESVPARPTAAPQRSAADDYEAGYAAGYRDAMNGRRPRFPGIDRLDPGTGVTGPTARVDGRGAAARTPAAGAYGTPYGGAYGSSYGATGTVTAAPYVVPGYGPPGVVVVPPSADPRYYNNGRYPPPGRANGVCLDRDGDGWCDDPRFGAPVCRDLDGDGRCDDYPALAAAPYPSALPEMRAGVDVRDGRGSATALQWLGTAEVVARLVNPKHAATPYRIVWYDANTNALLQQWTDLDGDGIADRVEIFRNGRRVKLLGR